MKKVLFVINTLGGAGAERALLELLTRFTTEKYEVSLYVLLSQGELIHQVPDYVRVLNQDYSDGSVLSRRGKLLLNKRLLKRIFIRKAIFRDCPYLIKNLGKMVRKGRIWPDKLMWRVMSDSGQAIRETFDLAVAYLEGGSTYFVHDYVRQRKRRPLFMWIMRGQDTAGAWTKTAIGGLIGFLRYLMR